MRRFVVVGMIGGVLMGAIGCGTSAGSTTSTPTAVQVSPSASPTPGVHTTLRVNDFSVAVPGDWTDHTHDTEALSAAHLQGKVLLLVETKIPGQYSRGVNDVVPNINVTIPPQSPVPDSQLLQYVQSVRESGRATNVSDPLDIDVDGEHGLYVTYDEDVNGTPGRSDDIVLNHGGQTYEFLFNTSVYSFGQLMPTVREIIRSVVWTQQPTPPPASPSASATPTH
jgi:hypothetical protein